MTDTPTVISWNTQKTDAGAYRARVYSFAYQQTSQDLAVKTFATRTQATGWAKRETLRFKAAARRA